MKSTAFYREKFLAYLNENLETREPKNLYDPMVYILNIGGKRLRPVSVLMAAELFDCPYEKALDAALAIEIFHNFSLVHDDIMDDAPVRRGKPSIHEKWNINTAILSGDAMLINAYQLFENYELETFKELAKLFSRTAIKVCEGQQYDVDYEGQSDVKIEDYLRMIEYKTGVLVGAAMEMGAIVANAEERCRKEIYRYGCLLGVAFQLMDDYLDIFGDFESFGKQIGGDIIENKKTFLYLTALKDAAPEDAKVLKTLYAEGTVSNEEKIEAVMKVFHKTNVKEKTLNKIEFFTNEAFVILDHIRLPEDKKRVLRDFGKKLMLRKK